MFYPRTQQHTEFQKATIFRKEKKRVLETVDEELGRKIINRYSVHKIYSLLFGYLAIKFGNPEEWSQYL